MFWIFVTYFVDRFYSASFMNPGNLEKNIVNTKAYYFLLNSCFSIVV